MTTKTLSQLVLEGERSIRATMAPADITYNAKRPDAQERIARLVAKRLVASELLGSCPPGTVPPESLVGPLAEAIQEAVWNPTERLLREMGVR